MTKIIIEDLKIYAYHGVLPQENIIGTNYLLNIELHVDLWRASESDDLNDTVNYATVSEIIHSEMGIPSKLIEHVCGRILNKIHEQFPEIEFAKIKLTKTSPPMKGETKGVSVEFEKSFV